MRRGFLRGSGRRGRGLALLNEANRMMESGDYKGAAAAFDQLAEAAERRGGRRAPLFVIQAGRARLLAGETAGGLPLLKHGLGMLAERGSWRRFEHLGQRIATELKGRGLSAEAAEIEALISGSISASSPLPAADTHRPALPAHCPSCGAAVHPGEVEWLDSVTAECDFCGSLLRAQE